MGPKIRNIFEDLDDDNELIPGLIHDGANYFDYDPSLFVTPTFPSSLFVMPTLDEQQRNNNNNNNDAAQQQLATNNNNNDAASHKKKFQQTNPTSSNKKQRLHDDSDKPVAYATKGSNLEIQLNTITYDSDDDDEDEDEQQQPSINNNNNNNDAAQHGFVNNQENFSTRVKALYQPGVLRRRRTLEKMLKSLPPEQIKDKINEQDKFGKTALHHMARYENRVNNNNCRNSAEVLVNAGANPNIQDKARKKPLAYAREGSAVHNYLKRVTTQSELEQPPSNEEKQTVDQNNFSVRVSEMFRDMYNNPDDTFNKLQEMLQSMSDKNIKNKINERDENGKTALHHAVIFDCLPSARLLLDVGADPNIQDNEGKTPLDHAEDLQFQNGRKLSLDQLKMHALVVAARQQRLANNNNNNDVAQQRLANNNNNNDVTQRRFVTNNNNNGNPGIQEKNFSRDVRLLYMPQVRGRIGALQELLRGRTDPNKVNEKDEFGKTALHHVVIFGCLSSAGSLLKAGADPNIKDGKGKTPLDYAEDLKFEEKRNLTVKAFKDLVAEAARQQRFATNNNNNDVAQQLRETVNELTARNDENERRIALLEVQSEMLQSCLLTLHEFITNQFYKQIQQQSVDYMNLVQMAPRPPVVNPTQQHNAGPFPTVNQTRQQNPGQFPAVNQTRGQNLPPPPIRGNKQ